jgi:hypothetical protein
MMKYSALLLLVLLIGSIIGLPLIVYYVPNEAKNTTQERFLGVSFGQDTAAEAKILIDKVKDYTNFFLIASWPLCLNETAMNEVCDYASNAGLHFMVFFDFISNQTYLWHQTWLDTAKQKWGDMFLGIYLFDEPGGRQIDSGGWDQGRVPAYFNNVKSQSDAAKVFVSLGQFQSFTALKSREIPVFTSDYALYWYDYKAGYDTVFVELGSNVSRINQIALCRGAANSFEKDWGAIITWTYNQAPYLANGEQILQDMHTAYDAGAKYVIVFNYYPADSDNPYGTLTDEHFNAIEQFWSSLKEDQQKKETTSGKVALILPKDYGGGLRRSDDNVWAPSTLPWRSNFPIDTQSSLIWKNMNTLSEKYGLTLNIIFDDDKILELARDYSKVYFWSDSLPQ